MFNGYWCTFKGETCLGCESDQAFLVQLMLRVRGYISLLFAYSSMVWTGIDVVVAVVVVLNVP